MSRLALGTSMCSTCSIAAESPGATFLRGLSCRSHRGGSQRCRSCVPCAERAEVTTDCGHRFARVR